MTEQVFFKHTTKL